MMIKTAYILMNPSFTFCTNTAQKYMCNKTKCKTGIHKYVFFCTK